MPLHNHPIFERLDDIPDVTPPKLLLPVERKDLRAPQAEVHTSNTISPLELSFCFFKLRAGNFPHEHHIIGFFVDDLVIGGIGSPEEFLAAKRGSHLGRVMMRAMLDPSRQAPINLAEVYRAESKFRGYHPQEETFFQDFVENWGVLNRTSRI